MNLIVSFSKLSRPLHGACFAVAISLFAVGACARDWTTAVDLQSGALNGCWAPASVSGAYSEIGNLLFEENKVYWVKTEYKNFQPVQEKCEANYVIREKTRREGERGKPSEFSGRYSEFWIRIDMPARCYIGNLEKNVVFRIGQDNPTYAEVLMYRLEEEVERGQAVASGNFQREDLRECQALRAK